MALSDGNYLIRVVPTNISWPFARGNYATRGDISAPITVQAQITTDNSNQIWGVRADSSSPNTYKITQPTNPNIHIGPVIGGFGLDNSGRDVIYSRTIVDWVLTQVDASANTYIIEQQSHEIGSINAVTVSNAHLVVQQIGLGDNKSPLPQWQFISQDDLD
ncbi:hypothetical protein JR316_0007637 [Psilocybe cubensis]|uniref:Uncharacterized protein n=2 Tax=Psilocybe cubensis TaxID=181762 RepID=A0ACB8GVQ1_PSICU|nr:hypothetical protein JR316_0007637 [Psilocybe cubensis]KAH9479060.1 hypothetical protein JR316_0007637 [Psilocybe cubensis]